MILIFDLDDTLYPEITYVMSGFKAVAAWGEELFGADKQQSYQTMVKTLETQGRGKVFDQWLQEVGQPRSLIKHAVKTYRWHAPQIALPDETVQVLERCKGFPSFVVTDGHKIVQDRKLTALGVMHYIKHAYITHRYGIRNAKPSLHCFCLIKGREKVDWGDLIYIGDNPMKDFVNLNKVGAKTIRLRQGMFKDYKAQAGYDAQETYDTLTDAVNSILT